MVVKQFVKKHRKVLGVAGVVTGAIVGVLVKTFVRREEEKRIQRATVKKGKKPVVRKVAVDIKTSTTQQKRKTKASVAPVKKKSTTKKSAKKTSKKATVKKAKKPTTSKNKAGRNK